MKSSRLLSIVLLLQAHERMTSQELARRCEVSPRTILRDVEALSAAGIPVYTEQGRGGAIVLDRRARFDVTRLDPAELQLLAVAGLDTNLLKQVGLHSVQSRVEEKLTAVSARREVSSTLPLSQVLLADPLGWFKTGQELDLTDLLSAARERRRIRLCYRRSGEASGQPFIADPYGLVSKAGSWYLVADVEGRPRMFNTIRIEGFESFMDSAVLRPDQDVRSVWQDLVSGFQSVTSIEVRALLRSTRLDLLSESWEPACVESLALRGSGYRLLSAIPILNRCVSFCSLVIISIFWHRMKLLFGSMILLLGLCKCTLRVDLLTSPVSVGLIRCSYHLSQMFG